MTIDTGTSRGAMSDPQSSQSTTGRVGQQVGEQAAQVASTAKDEARSLMDQGRREMRSMMAERGQQAAEGLRRFGQEISSLSSGHPEQAQRLQGYLDQARTRVEDWAGRLETGGVDGLMADVKQYARRRPGVFLVGAAGAGFVIGRMLRVGATAGSQGFTDTTGGTQNGVRGVGGQGWIDSTGSGTMVATSPAGIDPQRGDPTVVVTATGGDPW